MSKITQVDHYSGPKRASQVEVTPLVKQVLAEWNITEIRTAEDLVSLRRMLNRSLIKLPYNDETMAAEEAIRWKRTGSKILADKHVYRTKSCTDIIVAFTALALGAGVKNARFVKLKNTETGMLHSVGEFELADGWYVFDVSDMTAVPVKGELSAEVPYIIEDVPGQFIVWQKGRDSWDLGLNEYSDGLTVTVDISNPDEVT